MIEYIPRIVMGIIAISIAVYNRKNQTLDKKVDKENCDSFRRRIGKESDEHEKNIIDLKNGQTKIQKCLIFLVQANNGNPAEMGLME